MVQKGAHISLVYCVHRPTDCILPVSYIGNSILGWWTRSNKHAINYLFQTSKKRVETSE